MDGYNSTQFNENNKGGRKMNKCFTEVEKAIAFDLDRIDKEKLEHLKGYCHAISLMSEDLGGEGFFAQLDTETMCIKVAFDVPLFYVDESFNPFYSLLERAVGLSISYTPDYDVRITFTFPSLEKEKKHI